MVHLTGSWFSCPELGLLLDDCPTEEISGKEDNIDIWTIAMEKIQPQNIVHLHDVSAVNPYMQCAQQEGDNESTS